MQLPDAGHFGIDTWVGIGALSVAVVVGVVSMLRSRQVRCSEVLLAAERRRDRLALDLADCIRTIGDPGVVVDDVLAEVGAATGCRRVVLVSFEGSVVHGSGTGMGNVRDLAGTGPGDPIWHRWSSPEMAQLLDSELEPPPALRSFLLEGSTVLRDASGLVIEDAPGSSRRKLELQDQVVAWCGRIECPAVLALPLLWRRRVVAALVLLGDGQTAWEAHAMPLAVRIAPQLAAAIAQQFIARQQRRTLESLQEVERLRERLVAQVSHEVRTPLTSILGFVETLLREDIVLPASTRHELLVGIREGGHRLMELAEDLLELGSAGASVIELRPSRRRVSALVEEATFGIELRAPRRLVIDLHDDPLVDVDPHRFVQLLGNLVRNAQLHGAGVVTIGCHVAERHVAIDVTDEGAGIPAANVEELFLPFARLTDRSDSAGLGLAIARTIAEAHGGTLEYVAASRDHPHCFRVCLPRSLAEPVQEDADPVAHGA